MKLILPFLLPFTLLSALPASDSSQHALALPEQQLGQGTSSTTAPGWSDPRMNGGSILNPLNVIISSASTPSLVHSEHGFVSWARSLGLWNECANLHLGDPQFANLGDGNEWQAELFEMRESPWPYVGSCLESIVGGQHFRAWKQNGTIANTGAWFLAASREVDLKGNHKITSNGYNEGRDYIVETAIAGTRYRRRSWTATVEWIDGLLPPGSEGVNHDIAQDGRVAVLTVTEF